MGRHQCPMSVSKTAVNAVCCSMDNFANAFYKLSPLNFKPLKSTFTLVRVPVFFWNTKHSTIVVEARLNSPPNVRFFSTTAQNDNKTFKCHRGRHQHDHSRRFKRYKEFYCADSNSAMNFFPNVGINCRGIKDTVNSCSAFRNVFHPKLIGGTLPRNAWGYSIGGSSRLFSTYGITSRDVVQNMNSHIRTKLVSTVDKGKAFYNPEPVVSVIQTMALARSNSEEHHKGCYVDFKFNPKFSIRADAFLDPQVMKQIKQDLDKFEEEIKLIYKDIEKISTNLGELPVSINQDTIENVVRVHFPNCDAEHARSLLRDIGVTRGAVYEEEESKVPVVDEIRSMVTGNPSLNHIPRNHTESIGTDDLMSLTEDNSSSYGSGISSQLQTNNGSGTISSRGPSREGSFSVNSSFSGFDVNSDIDVHNHHPRMHRHISPLSNSELVQLSPITTRQQIQQQQRTIEVFGPGLIEWNEAYY